MSQQRLMWCTSSLWRLRNALVAGKVYPWLEHFTGVLHTDVLLEPQVATIANYEYGFYWYFYQARRPGAPLPARRPAGLMCGEAAGRVTAPCLAPPPDPHRARAPSCARHGAARVGGRLAESPGQPTGWQGCSRAVVMHMHRAVAIASLLCSPARAGRHHPARDQAHRLPQHQRAVGGRGPAAGARHAARARPERAAPPALLLRAPGSGRRRHRRRRRAHRGRGAAALMASAPAAGSAMRAGRRARAWTISWTLTCAGLVCRAK